MIFGLFRQRKNNRAIIDRQYATLTAAARQPAFYAALDVPDTVMGRFEMLSLVMILYFRRTARCERSGQEVAQAIVDAFFEDIDHSLRELGIGDQSVPKRMKKLAGMFYGRLETYGKALDLGDRTALAAALRRNIHPERTDAPDMALLAGWALEAEERLRDSAEEAVLTGAIDIVPPSQEQVQS
ncbi:ubiquinol-cytochrome C chaperone family protein [Rhizobium paknamense]|uniref:Cytochrome b pre-mRNA-processing protein 3 n=1 Tax=Rhizobium paknamense TaxID=1206817 RepID=A0ABU0I785_9HYPH|nr:ubiquinol-cytochrome C chaperone family protein [Rhizobium paknamense]MDQ0454076.1 cytochrome b pre-mRNA-processing protein 3 [Rhizobium paknamense]